MEGLGGSFCFLQRLLIPLDQLRFRKHAFVKLGRKLLQRRRLGRLDCHRLGNGYGLRSRGRWLGTGLTGRNPRCLQHNGLVVPENPHHSAGLVRLRYAVGCSLDPVQKLLVSLDQRWALGRAAWPEHVLAGGDREIHPLGNRPQHGKLIGCGAAVVGDLGARTGWPTAPPRCLGGLRGLQRLATVKIRDREISGAVDGACVGGRLTRRNFGRRVGHDFEKTDCLERWPAGPAPGQKVQLSVRGAGKSPSSFFMPHLLDVNGYYGTVHIKCKTIPKRQKLNEVNGLIRHTQFNAAI